MSEDLNKLRELATRAPVHEWHEWMSRGTSTFSIHDENGREVIHWSGFDASSVETKAGRERLCRYVGAFNPSTALSLIARLQAAEERAEKVREDLALTAALARELFKRDCLIVETDKLVFTGPWARVGFVSVSEILDRADAALKTGA